MSDKRQTPKVVPSGGPLVAAAALVVVTLVTVASASLTDVGKMRVAEPITVETRLLLFEDGHDGAVVVRDSASLDVVAVLPPGRSGFVRSTVRALAYERKRDGIGAEQPFVLARFSDGGMSLQDPSTGSRIELNAFGLSNVRAFVPLMDSGSPQR